MSRVHENTVTPIRSVARRPCRIRLGRSCCAPARESLDDANSEVDDDYGKTGGRFRVSEKRFSAVIGAQYPARRIFRRPSLPAAGRARDPRKIRAKSKIMIVGTYFVSRRSRVDGGQRNRVANFRTARVGACTRFLNRRKDAERSGNTPLAGEFVRRVRFSESFRAV